MANPVVYILFGTFFALLGIGSPIAVALGISALASFVFLGENPIKLVQIAFTSVGSFPLMALPAFILAGALMEAAGISKRLVAVAETFAGPFTGGLAAATVFACLFFGAISGSGPATTAAVGMLMIPAMAQRGYAKDYAAAVTASGGSLGIIIPPSIPMVIFGISALGMQPPVEAVARHGSFATVSIPKLFVAGVLPGLLMAASLLAMNYVLSRRNGYSGAAEGWSAGAIGRAVRQGKWSILAPAVILGGIYSGLFTPTEAAIVAIFYTIFIGFCVHRELEWRHIGQCLETTTWITGRVLLILFTATAFGRLLVENRIPATIAEAMLSATDNLYVLWTIIILFLLFVGMFMETLAAILILTPVLLPVGYNLGIDPTHFGIVVICTLAVGFQTPPLGENLFVSSGVSNTSIERIFVKIIPFTIMNIIAVFLIAFFPGIALWLPRQMGF
jgi:C4-dicarboxylate transporter DctM subunit